MVKPAIVKSQVSVRQNGLKRFALIFCGAFGLFLVYLFQEYLNLYSLITEGTLRRLNYPADFIDVNRLEFIVNKVFRYILNDLFAIALLHGLFYEKKYLRFAFYVMIFGLLVLVPLYLFIYLNQPRGFSSMLSHLHRLVMNPVLMMLLIPAFYYQRRVEKKSAN